MNINLGNAKKKQTKASIGYGLNSRGAKEAAKKKSNVFDDDDDDSDGPDNEPKDEDLSGREQVNQQIAKEQAALRARAQAAAAAIKDPSIYDYDGAYDSFKPQEDKSKVEEKDRKSRYVGDLLVNSKKREREREAIHERKVAREQAEEDAHEDYRGKEKFVTKAYKRKLEERKQWEAQEEETRKNEEEDDVTKKKAAFGNFYGNFSRNVAMGGKLEETNEDKEKTDGAVDDPIGEFRSGPMADFTKASSGMDFLDGFAKSDEPGGDEEHANDEVGEPRSTAKEIDSKQPPPSDGLSIRERREKKVAEARVRYLERQQLMLQ
jgi:coiled-coil domain-containing protein 55